MKKVFFSALLLTGISSASFAQTTNAPVQAPSVAATQQEEKVKVDPAALPEAVKKTLAGDAYKGWQATTAWTSKSRQDLYTVELKNADKTQTIKISKDGTVR